MTHRTNWIPLLAALVAAFAFPACGGGGGGGGAGGDDPALRVVVTDSPFPFEDVLSATVRIQRVELRDASGGFLVLVDFSGEGGRELDLVQLRNGAVATLFEGDPAPGSYDLVRIIVEAVEITIDDGGIPKVFDEFKIPSGEQTGVKVFVDPPISVTTGLSQDLVLDFDLAGSFVVQGNPKTPAGIKGFHFKPVVRAVNASTAGTLTFRVMSDNGTPGNAADDFFLNGAAYEVKSTVDGSIVASGASGTDPGDATRDGYVFHPAVPAGGYEFEVGASEHEDYEQGIVIAAANRTDLGTIVLAKSTNRISGAVVTVLRSTTGTDLEFAVPAATVNALAEGTTVVVKTDDTNSAGQYEITSVTSGNYDLEVTAAGYAAGSDQVTIGATDDVEVDFVLVPLTADVTGTVKDDQGNLVAGATVRAIVDYAGQDEVIAETTADTNGDYTIADLPTGTYVIRAVTSETTPRNGEEDLEHVGGTAATMDVEVR